jgi:glycosyltransferase involved in cell wall biosynthesis
VLEAMACGKAVVATDTSGHDEILQNGHNGLLVPPKTIVPLADAILRVAKDYALAERLGKCAAGDVRRRFDRRTMVVETERAIVDAVRLHESTRSR